MKKLERSATQKRIEGWLKSKIPNAKNLTTSWERDSQGASNETHFVDVNWEENGRQEMERLVFRWEVKDNVLFPEYDLTRQCRVMQCLKNSGVPVPPVRWFEEDAGVLGWPFYVMSRVEGDAPPTMYPGPWGQGLFFDASPERRTAMWQRTIEAMAKIHSLDWKNLGLSFLGAPEPDGNPLDHEIAYWEHCIDWAGDDPAPIVLKALDWIKQNKYQPSLTSLCWGDARPGNILYHDDKVSAVVDWELAHIGVPECDLFYFTLGIEAQFDNFKIPILEGILGPEETVKYYEEVAGRKAENPEYHQIFQLFKMAVFFHLGCRAFFKTRQEMPPGLSKTNNFPCRKLEQFLG